MYPKMVTEYSRLWSLSYRHMLINVSWEYYTRSFGQIWHTLRKEQEDIISILEKESPR